MITPLVHVPLFAATTGPAISTWILGGLAGLFLIKTGLEFFGIVPPSNKKEIDELRGVCDRIDVRTSEVSSAVVGHSDDFSSVADMVEQVHRIVADTHTSEHVKKVTADVEETLRLCIILEDLHKTPVGTEPSWWCSDRDGSRKRDLQSIKDLITTRSTTEKPTERILAQNLEMVVKLLGEVLDHVKK